MNEKKPQRNAIREKDLRLKKLSSSLVPLGAQQVGHDVYSKIYCKLPVGSIYTSSVKLTIQYNANYYLYALLNK